MIYFLSGWLFLCKLGWLRTLSIEQTDLKLVSIFFCLTSDRAL